MQDNLNISFDIVMVNYKTLALTKISLELLKKHLDAGMIKPQVNVWVVDNDSQDESTQYLRSLSWIKLIERKSPGKEQGFAAHGHALDLVLAQTQADYLFLLHTDTFIYDASVFELMLKRCLAKPNTVAVGCLEQLDRGHLRRAWRLSSRYVKHHVRRLKLSLGLSSKEPKPYKEEYIKSFCALWDIKRMKAMQLQFFMNNRIPGYELQDLMQAQGYGINLVSPSKLFKYLDHVEAGTVGLVSGYDAQNRRVKRKQSLLKKYDT